MSAYYNEIDPYAAQWLRNLIAAGEIAPGDVDERSITEVHPDDLRPYRQCHFFAGIGVWSHALRRAGWSDDEEVWTGRCPCQPFSAAGQRQGFADQRHLWPVWFRLVAECRPAIVLGEQVASALQWVDLVSADMEGAGYAFGAADLCAAGFGQPGIGGFHIRQRLYFCAVADPDHKGLEGRRRVRGGAGERVAGPGGVAGGLADADSENCGRRGICEPGQGDEAGLGATRERSAGLRADGRMANAASGNARAERQQRGGEHRLQQEGQLSVRGICGGGECHPDRGLGTDAADPMRAAADWLFCRDGKWRPVEPGTFPLADAPAARVGRLRAYGNGLDLKTATEFCGAVREARQDAELAG